MPRTHFVLGGARSGKSAFAERIVGESGREKVYLATGQALDEEMRERIAHHRHQRGSGWTTVEEPLNLPVSLKEAAAAHRIVLVDCLTLWVSNLMMAGRDPDAAFEELAAVLPRLAGPAVLVSNEVGLGIVPENAMARAFRDHAGRLNQRVAAICDRVTFIAAGLPLTLKG
jgi:adenosylcobinamide kinase/adenosylcobinamide-phosphate guanylyltransferase